MKPVSIGQVGEVIGRFATQTSWAGLDGDKLQVEVINLTPEEFGRRMTAFFRNGMRFIYGGLKIACAPFNPSDFIGKGWTFWKGPKDGNGLEGEKERDRASLALAEVDFSKADFLTCLKPGKGLIIGEEKLVCLKKLGRTVYGATVAMGLWQNYQACRDKAESVLERLYQQMGITYIDFPGDVLRGPAGDRYALFFSRDDVGQWDWRCSWLGGVWSGRDFSAVSRQVSSNQSSEL